MQRLFVILAGAAAALAQNAPDHPSVTAQGKTYTPRSILTRNMGTPEDQTTAFPPHKIVANVYYVGTRTLSAFLIVTPRGNILIDSTYERNVRTIQKSVEQLGFKFSDTKILLGNHAHGDHMEGDALVKELTGAQVVAMAEDVPALKEMKPGGKEHPIDRIIHDGDTVTLGDATLTAHLTAGHTRGATTWTMPVTEAGKTYQVVFYTSLRSPAVLTPAVIDEFNHSFAVVRTLPCDVPLGDHPAEYAMAEKYAKLKPGVPNPFIDPAGCRIEADLQELMFKAVLAEQGHAQTVSPKRSCASLLNFDAPAVAFSKAETVAASAALPGYCLVQGTINKRMGAGGREFGIGFELRLPDAWTERFLFQGGGGMDGVVRPASGAVPISGSTAMPALARGFAVATTDSGHQGQGGPFAAPADSSFGIDQQARVDQAYGGFMAVTELARRMIAGYYGQGWKKSYFMGCSNGGRQALLAVQRFPLAFDGVMSVAPAARVGTATISSVWETIAFSEIAPKDDAGRPIVSKAFSNGDLNLLGKAVAEACDAKDGVKDGLIFDTKDCHFDPAMLSCEGAKTDTCLSAQQLSVLKKVFAGPKNSRGEALYSDWPYDTGVAAPGWRALKLGTSETATPNSADVMLMFSGLKGFFFTPPDPRFDPMKFNFDTDPARLSDTNVLQDSMLTFLSTFSARGGKLMMIHGMSDPFFSAYDTARYYEGVVRDNGGLEKTMPWVRFFEVPGMNHCGGGPALEDFDPLTALVDWTEKDQAPEHMVATGKSFAGVSRPVCAYPAYPHYRGSGSQEDAANFECK